MHVTILKDKCPFIFNQTDSSNWIFQGVFDIKKAPTNIDLLAELVFMCYNFVRLLKP